MYVYLLFYLILRARSCIGGSVCGCSASVCHSREPVALAGEERVESKEKIKGSVPLRELHPSV